MAVRARPNHTSITELLDSQGAPQTDQNQPAFFILAKYHQKSIIQVRHLWNGKNISYYINYHRQKIEVLYCLGAKFRSPTVAGGARDSEQLRY
jgi:hypothetical protein